MGHASQTAGERDPPLPLTIVVFNTFEAPVIISKKVTRRRIVNSKEPELPKTDEESAQAETDEKPALLARIRKRFWRFTEKTGQMAIRPFKGIL